ncbi:MAG: efflux transporter outer membrane subunit [Burkholderiales bacterium]
MKRRSVLAAAGAMLLAACTVGPDYRRPPPVAIPVTWKLEAPWREGTPNDTAPKGNWWERFSDPHLTGLVQQSLAANQTLVAASARLEQARSTLASASAGLYPQVGVGGRFAHQRISANRPLTRYNVPNAATTQNDFVLSVVVAYEPDLFGRIQRSIEGAAATAEQSAADLENTRLVITADLATAYFNLRTTDTELDVLARSIGLQRRALEYVTTRRDLGAASGLDVAQQQALLDITLTQVNVLRKNRAQFEHAIATLIGTPAPMFSLAPDLGRVTPPPVPLGVPSDVLERRPDVAAAERAMAAANAQIGVATSAFYPSFVMAPFYGAESTSLGNLFSLPSVIWSVGVSVLQPIFNAGRLQANVDFTKAGYDVTVANYRRIVLTAMQEVEDGISGTVTLDQAHAQAQVAVESTKRVLDLANTRYDGGVSAYLDVITAQQALLNTERQAAQLHGQRLLISVFLVKALGGDWDTNAAQSAVDPKLAR